MHKLHSTILQHANSHKTVCIACSGGVDSMFLVKVCSQIVKNSKVFAIIVNHNLQESSASVASETLKIVQSWGVDGIILNWIHDDIATAIEESARNARYGLIADFCKKNNITSVMLAHHIDDKIETFLMNAMRGTGIAGLVSMQERSQMFDVEFCRPMIHTVEKSKIVEFMTQNQVPWFEDVTNQDKTLTRNYIRHSFEFSHQQKMGILKTISNLENELIDKKKILYRVGFDRD